MVGKINARHGPDQSRFIRKVKTTSCSLSSPIEELARRKPTDAAGSNNMTVPQLRFTPPTNSVFRWLTDSDTSVPSEIRTALLGELFATPKAVLAGVINGLILNIAALVLHAGVIFAVFAVVDIFLVIFRVRVLKFAVDAATAGQPTITDVFKLT